MTEYDKNQNKVYEEFLRTAQKKRIGSKELDAMVASVALQVPATYKLVSYVVNNGNGNKMPFDGCPCNEHGNAGKPIFPRKH